VELNYCKKGRRGERKKGKEEKKKGRREREKRGEMREVVILITTNHFSRSTSKHEERVRMRIESGMQPISSQIVNKAIT
jgi:hypothetical protein